VCSLRAPGCHGRAPGELETAQVSFDRGELGDDVALRGDRYGRERTRAGLARRGIGPDSPAFESGARACVAIGEPREQGGARRGGRHPDGPAVPGPIVASARNAVAFARRA
jgi:hypothetical protein